MYPARPTVTTVTTVTTVYLLTSFIDNNHRYRAKMSHAANIKLSCTCSKEFYAQRAKDKIPKETHNNCPNMNPLWSLISQTIT